MALDESNSNAVILKGIVATIINVHAVGIVVQRDPEKEAQNEQSGLLIQARSHLIFQH
jgi:hypothetical protein